MHMESVLALGATGGVESLNPKETKGEGASLPDCPFCPLLQSVALPSVQEKPPPHPWHRQGEEAGGERGPEGPVLRAGTWVRLPSHFWALRLFFGPWVRRP